MKIKYNKIYLVAQGLTIHSEHRVTKRKFVDGLALPPATCMFSGARGDENNEPMGTLVIDEELWEKWYGRYKPEEFIPGMETARSAAEKMVRECDWVLYGCPLCQQRWGLGNLKVAQKHAADEMQRMLEMFELIEED